MPKIEMLLPEEKIVRPKSPSVAGNQNAWEIFHLRNVRVLSEETGEPISLLSTRLGKSVKVTGQLEKDKDLEDLMIIPDYYIKSIKVQNVVTYAFGEYSEGGGGYAFWAAGKGGWYEFDSVAPTYAATYEQMKEALWLLYLCVEGVTSSHIKKPNWTKGEVSKNMQSFFKRIPALAKDPTRFADVEDVRERILEHREFLITSMIEGAEDVDWVDTKFWQYLKQRFPDDFKMISARLGVQSPKDLPSADTRSQTQASSTKSKATQSPLLLNEGRKRASRAATNHHPSLPLPSPTPSSSPPPAALSSVSPDATEPTSSQSRRSKKRSSPPIRIESPAKKKRGRPFKAQLPPTKMDSSSDDEIVFPDRPVRKEKSFLRPPGTIAAKKTRAPGRPPRDEPAAEEELAQSDSGSEEVTKAAANFDITTIEDGEDLDLLTNPHYKRLDDFEGFERTEQPPSFLPRKYLEIRAVEYVVPSPNPKEDGTWVCSFEDCRKRIHGAAEGHGSRLVRAHLKEHIGDSTSKDSVDARAKLDVVLDESRPYLPVGNLLRHLQAFAPDPGTEPGPNSLQRSFQAPIRRKY